MADEEDLQPAEGAVIQNEDEEEEEEEGEVPYPAQQNMPQEMVGPEAQQYMPQEMVEPEAQQNMPQEMVGPEAQQYMPQEMVGPLAQQYMPQEIVEPQAQQEMGEQPLSPDQQYLTPETGLPPQQIMPPELGDQGALYGTDNVIPAVGLPTEKYPGETGFFFGPLGDDEGEEGDYDEDDEEEEAAAEEETPQKPPFPLPQYVEPKMPPDLRICDRYFVKPGEWGVTPSGTLVPGTGMRPPNVPIPDGLQDDSLTGFLGLTVEPKGGSQLSFFKSVLDTCSIDTKDKADEEDISEEELIFESFDSEYLKTHLGIPLTLALAEIVAKKPTDPIHYLGHWLFKWHYNQEARGVEKEKVNELIRERERIIEAEKERKRMEEEKIALQLVEEIVTQVPDVMDPFELQDNEEEFGEEAIGEEVSGEALSEEAEQAFYADQNYYA